MRHGRFQTDERRRLRPRRSGDAGLPARRRAARGGRSATAVRSASRPRANSIPTSSRPIGAAASTSSRACSRPTSWPTSSATCTTSWTACRPSAARHSTPRAGRRLGADGTAPNLLWSKPLGDPFGGTKLANGRHPVKMFEPQAAADAPKEVVYLILGSLQFSEAALRVYGHPELLAVAAAINGPDFVPFNEALFIKEPGRGASVAWHQDGTTHWDSPEWDQGIHGFNFMAQLYGCTAANGVWVVPGSHKLGKIDIAALVAKAGSERLPDAVPMICPAGRRRHHQPPGAARLVRQHQHGLAGHGELRLPSPQVGAGRAGRRRPQRGRSLRRRAHPRAGAPDRLRHRRPPPALPRREALRLQAARRGGTQLPLGRRRPRPGSRTTTFSTSAFERTKNTDDVLTQPVNRVVISHAWSGDAVRDEELSMTGRKV